MRKVLDDMVLSSVYKWNAEDYKKMADSFPGNVDDSARRTSLNTSEFGIIPFKLEDVFNRLMGKLEPEAEECSVCYASNYFPVSKKEMCVLKALASFQVSKSEMLSDTVSNIFAQLLPQIVMKRGGNQYVLEAGENYGKLQTKLHDMVVGFVLGQLGGKRAAVVGE